jgi:hypothetical protein
MHGTSLLEIASALGPDVGLCEESTQQASIPSKVGKKPFPAWKELHDRNGMTGRRNQKMGLMINCRDYDEYSALLV